jgi:glycosyltransferase involved in cell wall biosynthesis
MRIRWIVSGTNVERSSPDLLSDLASYRYRAAIPLRALRERGHTCDWYALSPGEAIDDAHPALRDADALVFAKNHTEPHEVIALLERAHDRAVATVVDVCDDYFSRPHTLTPYYRALVERAGTVTASSLRLAAAIEDATDRAAHLVRDPYEGPVGTPRWSPAASGVRALWFGTPLNLPALLEDAMTLPARIEGYRLEVVALTRRCEGLEAAFAKMSGPNLTLTFQEWTLAGNWEALDGSDLVLIPVKSDEFSAAKGPNRVVEALRAGRYAVTGALAAYDEFKPFAAVGGDIAADIAWALDNRAAVLERIAAGQAYVAKHYSPQAVAAEWEAVLRDVSRRAP